MVARIFDNSQIRKSLSTNFIKWFLSDFPYRPADFEKVSLPLSGDSGCVLKNFRMLSLLMLKDATPELTALKEFYKDVIPFENCNGIPFCELDRERWAAIFFPLRTEENSRPSWGLVAKSGKGKTFFFNAYTESWNSSWDYEKNGPSCRLAETLAEKLLQSGNRDHIYAAAKEWIVTGGVGKNGNVVSVGLGNKLKLTTKRRFILPEANHDELPEADSIGKTIKFADTVEAAWNHITNQGTKNIPEASFPPEIDELHVLVGGNIKAQVASIIFSNPKKVFLWYSESETESKNPAEYIKYVVERYMKEFNKPVIEKIEKNLLSSKSMAEAEKTLKEHFDGLKQDDTVIFNVTSGNRIMSYAVQTIARAYRNIELIYRDADEPAEPEKYFFTRLIYNEFPPYSGKIWGKTNEKINTKFLCGKDRYEDGKDFYDKLIKKEE